MAACEGMSVFSIPPQAPRLRVKAKGGDHCILGSISKTSTTTPYSTDIPSICVSVHHAKVGISVEIRLFFWRNESHSKCAERDQIFELQRRKFFGVQSLSFGVFNHLHLSTWSSVAKF